MKFKKFIREHKQELEFNEDLTGLWDEISSKMPLQKKSTPINASIKVALIAATVGIICCALYFLIPKDDPQIKSPTNFAQLDNQSPLNKILTIKNDVFNNGQAKEIIETLIHIIKNDSNNNVRLAAIRATEKFISEEDVKITLINLLANEKDPYITIAVLNILQRGNVKESLPAFNQIIQNDTQQKFVKSEAQKGLDLLKNI